MKTIDFVQILIAFVALVLSIGFFKSIELEINFITTLLLTVFTISISIFFYSESNKISKKIMDILGRLNTKVTTIEEKTKKIEHLNRSKAFSNQDQVRRMFHHEKRK